MNAGMDENAIWADDNKCMNGTSEFNDGNAKQMYGRNTWFL